MVESLIKGLQDLCVLLAPRLSFLPPPLPQNRNAVVVRLPQGLVQAVHQILLLAQRFRLLLAHPLDFGVHGVVGAVDAGHRGGFVERGVTSFDVSVDESAVVLKTQSAVLVHLCKDKFFASVFGHLAPESLEAVEFQGLLGSDAFGRVQLQHPEKQIFDLFVALAK